MIVNFYKRKVISLTVRLLKEKQNIFTRCFQGYYMYIETSSPRQQGDNAKLELYLPGNGELGCLTFYYHMYGADIGTLNVFSGKMTVFNKSGDQGDMWRKAETTVVLGQNVSETHF